MKKQTLVKIAVPVLVLLMITGLVIGVPGKNPGISRQPVSEGGGKSINEERDFQHVTSLVWKTENKNLFYAIATGYNDFEPTIPDLSYEYSWDMGQGGSLIVNESRIPYQPYGRLLALNPFGKMQELVLSDAEEDIVCSYDEMATWCDIVLKRLYRFEGAMVNDKRDGTWVCRDTEGRKAYEGNYVNGKRDGKWIYYYSSGSKRAELMYAKSKRHGKWVDYAEDGTVLDQLTWQNNFPVERSASMAGLGHTKVMHSNANSRSAYAE